MSNFSTFFIKSSKQFRKSPSLTVQNIYLPYFHFCCQFLSVQSVSCFECQLSRSSTEQRFVGTIFFWRVLSMRCHAKLNGIIWPISKASVASSTATNWRNAERITMLQIMCACVHAFVPQNVRMCTLHTESHCTNKLTSRPHMLEKGDECSCKAVRK